MTDVNTKGLSCPKCGGSSRLGIQVLINVEVNDGEVAFWNTRLGDDLFPDHPVGPINLADTDPIACLNPQCGFAGTVAEFSENPSPMDNSDPRTRHCTLGVISERHPFHLVQEGDLWFAEEIRTRNDRWSMDSPRLTLAKWRESSEITFCTCPDREQR